MKVAVVGGGVIGVTTAYEVLNAGHDVTLIEADADVGLATSFANGGLLTPSMSDPWNSPGVWRDLLRYLGRSDAPMLLRAKALPSIFGWGIQFLHYSQDVFFNEALRTNTELSLLSIEAIQDIAKVERLAFDKNEKGVLKIYRNETALQSGLKKMDRVADLGVATCMLTKDELVQKEPSLTPIAGDLAGALYFPNDMSGDAAAFTKGLAAKFVEQGGTLKCGQTVQSLVVSKQRIEGIITAEETLAVDSVVLSAGAWTRNLLAPLWSGLPVRPVKGYSITFDSKDIASDCIPQIPIVDDDLHAAITPLGSRLRVAGTAEFTGFDDRLTKARLVNLQQLLSAVFPEASKTLLGRERGNWCGFRPASADGKPYVGETPIEGLFLNTGHGPFGWTMAAGSARLLMQLMTGKQTDKISEKISPLRAWRP
ncbi:FAD-dependent oxidoreductase [Kordiimonas sp.]|uniref:FAD-dependent oxidoreductase n=1 Tax=Kordiimonas sp. TaxID=1970157 RepID=UPI003A94A3AE